MQALDLPLEQECLRDMVSVVAAVDVDDAWLLVTTNVTVEDIREDDDYAAYRVRIPARVHSIETKNTPATATTTSWSGPSRKTPARNNIHNLT